MKPDRSSTARMGRGSSLDGVVERLQARGYHVTAPQFPLTALADDVARLRQVLDLQDGPTIVAGHSTAARSSPRSARTTQCHGPGLTSPRSAWTRANRSARRIMTTE